MRWLFFASLAGIVLLSAIVGISRRKGRGHGDGGGGGATWVQEGSHE